MTASPPLNRVKNIRCDDGPADRVRIDVDFFGEVQENEVNNEKKDEDAEYFNPISWFFDQKCGSVADVQY